MTSVIVIRGGRGGRDKNIAYTKEYQAYIADLDRYLFRPECFSTSETTQLEELTIVTRHYQCSDHPRYPFPLSGYDNDVLLHGSVFYRYRSYDSSGFHWLLSHRNGRQYLVFTQGLYGYSVLDLTCGRDYRYYPEGSFPTGETFIWCDLHYNPQNNMAAVDGCYWACPSSILLVDLTDPMSDATMIDVGDYYVGTYNDIRFHAWDGADLVAHTSPGKYEKRIVIPEADYQQWLKQEPDGR